MRVLSPREIITALITQFSEKCQLWAPKVLISLRKEKKRKIEENVQKGFLILELVKCIRSQIWPNEGFVGFFSLLLFVFVFFSPFLSCFLRILIFQPSPLKVTTAVIILQWKRSYQCGKLEANKTKKRSMTTQGNFLILKAKNKRKFQCLGQSWCNLVRWDLIDIYPLSQETWHLKKCFLFPTISQKHFNHSKLEHDTRLPEWSTLDSPNLWNIWISGDKERY